MDNIDKLLEDPFVRAVIIQQGRIEAAGNVLLRLGRVRFGEPTESTRATIEAIDDLRRLQLLTLHILKATSWDDLLDEGKVRPRSRRPDRPE
jgi:hypothetical protein